MSKLKSLTDVLSRPVLLHYALPVLMIYLVVGTIAQKYIGLYEATHMFFSAFVFWWGPVPLPGLPLILGIIITNLCFKLFLKSPWTRRNSGIILTHMSVLLLLLGGLLTMVMSEEGFIDLAEGEQKTVIADYHIRELALLNAGGDVVGTHQQKQIEIGDELRFGDLPLTLSVIETCQNCKIQPREQQDSKVYYSMAQHMQLSPDALRHEDEMNMSGVGFEMNGTDQDGIHVVLEDVLQWPEFQMNGETYQIVLRKQRRALPFSIRLLEFTKEMHPGTSLAKSYQSRVRIYDGDAQWESLISMNEPLRYKGYTFFQSSYLETPQGDVSVLAVVLNAGRTFPYISGILLCIGLLLHLWVRYGTAADPKTSSKTLKRALTSSLLTMLVLWPSSSHAFDMDRFGSLPVLHEGRVKPMQSFARAHMKRFSGKEEGAISWLVETLFNPALGENSPILKITNPDVLNILAFEKTDNKLFSYAQVSASLEKRQDIILSIIKTPEEQWTPAQKDLILLQQDMVLLGDLLTSLTLFLPINAALPEDVSQDLKPFSAKPLSYVDSLKFREKLDQELAAILRSKGQDLESYSPSEQQLTYLSFAAAKLRESGAKSSMFRVFPNMQNQTWFSPWAYILQGAGSPKTSTLFTHWQDLALAYHEKDSAGWNDLVQKIYDETINISGNMLHPSRLKAERFYNDLQPYKLSCALYVLCLISLMISRYVRQQPFLMSAAFASVFLGAVLHATGIGLRMFILNRPPVSTLYESVLFVGLVCVFYGLMAYLRKQEVHWLYIAAGIGALLHVVGFSHNQDGDSLLMLSAVLNTNFWLATHVICITAGYAFCLLASVMAHYVLGKAILEERNTPDIKLFLAMHKVALIALLFSSVGTVLGGIWADQSWGRFWGWDPKENGALLIVLWIVWVIHGRISGQMNNTWTAAGLAYLSVIVALSWFGVNLLGVGLHSYGFTDSATWSLGLFIGLETLIIAALLYGIQKHARNEQHAH